MKRKAPRNASLSSFLESYPDNYMVRDICGVSAMRVPKWGIRAFHLECAKRRLDVVFSVVLIAESEGDWRSRLSVELGWTRFPQADGTDPTRHSREGGSTVAGNEIVDPELLATMEELHSFDMLLYEYARENFERTE